MRSSITSSFDVLVLLFDLGASPYTYTRVVCHVSRHTCVCRVITQSIRRNKCFGRPKYCFILVVLFYLRAHQVGYGCQSGAFAWPLCWLTANLGLSNQALGQLPSEELEAYSKQFGFELLVPNKRVLHRSKRRCSSQRTRTPSKPYT